MATEASPSKESDTPKALFNSDQFFRNPPEFISDGLHLESNPPLHQFPQNPIDKPLQNDSKIRDFPSHDNLSQKNSSFRFKDSDFPTLISNHGNSSTHTNIRKTWREVLSGNSNSSQFNLSYYKPEEFNNMICARITPELLDRAKSKWINTIVLYVLGPKPYYHYLNAYVTRVWKPTCDFQIYTKENGFFLVRFEDGKECDRILAGGPYYYGRKLMILKKWYPGMKLNKEFLSTIPIWVKFPNYPIDFWIEETMSRVASVLGKPIKLDQITQGMARISFARILIEIDTNFKFPSEVPVIDFENKIYWQKVCYEWIPPLCKNCCCFGHSEQSCTMTKIWMQKDKGKVSDMDVDTSTQKELAETDSILENKATSSQSGFQKTSNSYETGEGKKDIENSTIMYASSISNFNSFNVLSNAIVDEMKDEHVIEDEMTAENELKKNEDNFSTQKEQRQPLAKIDENKFGLIENSSFSLGTTLKDEDLRRKKRKSKKKSLSNIYLELDKDGKSSSMNQIVIDNPRWIELTKQIKQWKPNSRINKKLKGVEKDLHDSDSEATLRSIS